MSSDLQQRIDSRLQRIANVLLLNASFIDNLGLLNGKMGIAIFFYHYARYTGNEVYETYAGELIDEIYEEINTNTPVDFANGLTGIGWGIEYLVQNGFVEADTDEALEQIDEAVYQKILLNPKYKELKGLLLYQLARNKSASNNDQKELLKKHTNLCLLGECEKLLVYKNFKDQVTFPDQETLKAIQNFFIEVDKSELLTQKIRSLLDCILTYLEIVSSNNEDKENKTLINKATKIVVQQLIYSKNKDLDPDTSGTIFQEICDFIDEEVNWQQTIDNLDAERLCLNSGIAGIGLYLLKNIISSNPINKEPLNVKDDKLNIFFIVHDFSGARTYANELLEYIKDKASVYQIFLYDKYHKEFIIKKENEITNIYIPNNKTTDSLGIYYKNIALTLYVNFLSLQNSVIHANMPDQYYFVEELKKLFQCPVVYTLHFLEGSYSYLERIINYKSEVINTSKTLLYKMIQLSDYTICVTKFAERTITRLYQVPANKTSTIYNGRMPDNSLLEVRDVKSKSQYYIAPDNKIILYAGQLGTRKGIDKLIKAFLILKDKYPGTILIIAGTGDYDKYMHLANECIGRIRFAGNLDKETLRNFYYFSDIGVVPSQFEQCSYVAIEMMHYGIPLIISDVPGLNEMVSHKETGLVCKSKPSDTNSNILEADEIDLALQIEYLLQNKAEAIKLGLAAQQCALKKYSLDNMGKKTLKIYIKLTNERKLDHNAYSISHPFIN